MSSDSYQKSVVFVNKAFKNALYIWIVLRTSQNTKKLIHKWKGWAMKSQNLLLIQNVR